MQKLALCIAIALVMICGCSPAEQAERAADELADAANEVKPTVEKPAVVNLPADRTPLANPPAENKPVDKPSPESSTVNEPPVDKIIPTGDGVLPLDDEASAVAFSPDGRLLAVGLTFGGIQLWDMATRTKRADLPANFGTTHALAFSPDGATLASGHTRREGNVILWDVATGRRKTQLAGHTNKVYAVAFSPDGKTLASAGADTTVRLWNPVTGESQRVLEGHKNEIHGLAFAPDGELLASSSGDFLKKLPGEVLVWNAGTGERVKAMETKQSYDVAFTPDGRSLLATDGEGISLWSTETWEPARQFRQVIGFGFNYERIDVSPGGRLRAGDRLGPMGSPEGRSGQGTAADARRCLRAQGPSAGRRQPQIRNPTGRPRRSGEVGCGESADEDGEPTDERQKQGRGEKRADQAADSDRRHADAAGNSRQQPPADEPHSQPPPRLGPLEAGEKGWHCTAHRRLPGPRGLRPAVAENRREPERTRQ